MLQSEEKSCCVRGRFAPRVPSLYPFQTQPKGKKERKYHASLAPSVKVPKFLVSFFLFLFGFGFGASVCRNVGNSPSCVRRSPTLHLTGYGGVDGWKDPQVCRPQEGGRWRDGRIRRFCLSFQIAREKVGSCYARNRHVGSASGRVLAASLGIISQVG
ncbi:hypothetical protein EDB80DRAFT_341358 [Ilyonectria destructans]|nr:hypothetical protein EDB80DRAFT_341358 [Ilyonectria destructans]